MLTVVLSVISSPALADESSDSEFAWFSFAPEIGYVHFFETTVHEKLNAKLAARDGIVLKGHVDIGGDGIALEIAPLYAWESGGKEFGDFNVLGAEITLALRANSGNFYPGIGIGFHGAYIFENDYINSGSELFARVPLGFTWYFMEYLGLVFEFGLMYGGTGVRVKEEANHALAESDKAEFGAGFAFDILVGLRFP
ncbi:MAG: hypothetical protein GY854_30620 [Deltaproteobacteria bacterium]|nr:hypothetical protein [Deltaproteobacteria bacterium]